MNIASIHALLPFCVNTGEESRIVFVDLQGGKVYCSAGARVPADWERAILKKIGVPQVSVPTEEIQRVIDRANNIDYSKGVTG